jgi:hypothetical protein
MKPQAAYVGLVYVGLASVEIMGKWVLRVAKGYPRIFKARAARFHGHQGDLNVRPSRLYVGD